MERWRSPSKFQQDEEEWLHMCDAISYLIGLLSVRVVGTTIRSIVFGGATDQRERVDGGVVVVDQSKQG